MTRWRWPAASTADRKVLAEVREQLAGAKGWERRQGQRAGMYGRPPGSGGRKLESAPSGYSYADDDPKAAALRALGLLTED